MVPSAELLHQRDPQLRVALKLCELGGVDDVPKIAGNHSALPISGVRYEAQLAAARFKVELVDLDPKISGCRRYGATTGFVSVPTPSYVHVMRSPAFSRIGGVRAEPTPGGVPVAMTSPGRNVTMLLA